MTDEQKDILKYALIKAHYNASFRDNASTQVLKAAYISNGGLYIPAVTAAMQTFGGLHAPIKATYNLLEYLLMESREKSIESVTESLSAQLDEEPNYKVPGFGSSFYKGGQKDPILWELESLISDQWTLIAGRIRGVLLHEGKSLSPNLAFYTAVTMIELGININLCETIMLEARLKAWNEILAQL